VPLKIPGELLEQADRISDLRGRVTPFIKLEVVQYEMRQTRFRPGNLTLVARAKAIADEKRMAGVDLDEEMTAFLHRLDKLTPSKAP
jgi:hypothetical protein